MLQYVQYNSSTTTVQLYIIHWNSLCEMIQAHTSTVAFTVCKYTLPRQYKNIQLSGYKIKCTLSFEQRPISLSMEVGDQREIGKPIILWMDKILHYFETWEPICLLVLAEESSFQRILGGAGFRPSIVGEVQKSIQLVCEDARVDWPKKNPTSHLPLKRS